MPLDSELDTTPSTPSLSQNLAPQQGREEQLQRLRSSLRPGQQSLAQWQGGTLAVSAVPGAGKSHSMAIAAAIAIARYQLHPKRQLVVVTFTRSAAASIKSKIRDCLRQLQLPLGGFVVHTLHGLALNIATRHPDLSQLNLETSTLIAPNQSHRLLKAAVEQWIARNRDRYSILLEGLQFDGEETERLRRQLVLRADILPSLANTAIREAKSSGLLPEDLAEIGQQTREEYAILTVAAGLYQQYEKLMKARSFIDYDDMILGALRVLENPNIRRLWQSQVFAVFEDEAQDSTPLQSRLLEILAGRGGVSPPAQNSVGMFHETLVRNSEVGTGFSHPDKNQETETEEDLNLIRVGDPNQAINSTFTPADPIYFNRFCDRASNRGTLATMNQAGRSHPLIINAANFVLHWVNQTWLNPDGKSPKPNSEAPFRPQDIQPVPPGDPQGNPEAIGNGVELVTPDDIIHTAKIIGDRAVELFNSSPELSAAILVRENRQGRFLAEQLAQLQRESAREPSFHLYEVSEAERHSHIPEELLKLLQFLNRPHSPDSLKAALEVLVARQLVPTQDLNRLATQPEQFLYPGLLEPPQKPQVARASQYCRNLLRARIELPNYQLIAFLGMTLNYSGSELATVHKLGDRVARQVTGQHSLSAILDVLREIVTSERFEGVEEDTEDRYTRPGQLTIITMHKAKGLDWDCVFIPFLHDDLIPGKPWVPTGGKFLGDFTLAEVARAQIRNALHQRYLDGESRVLPQPLEAWEQAMKLKKAEEYRLLYVAMTRAKRLLWMSAAQQGPFSWSTFSWQRAHNFQKKTPCPAFRALSKKQLSEGN
ncbi:MAG: ATP-dependent helicase [Cyanobacteriota bacterium]|nr:ATP-dependent helicase [Cyanobacteriota bacterium]